MSITDLITERILVLDGAMGTLIQREHLTEEDFRGQRFANHSRNLKGNNDLLSITKPDIITNIHRQYCEAGTDIISTNTFNANRISQADYGLEDLCYELCFTSAQIARSVADQYSDKRYFVAGSIGPTNRTASMSPDVNDPSFRNVTFDELVEAYTEQIRGLIDGGVDILLIETVFDTINCKSALFVAQEYFDKIGKRYPLLVSCTIEKSGRTLSGQTLEAFYNSIEQSGILSVGLNCAMGAEQLRPYLQRLSHVANCFVSAHPNAGLPNQFGDYDQSPDKFVAAIEDILSDGTVNIIGGCCGTTPKHIREIVSIISKYEPRQIPHLAVLPCFSGLESLIIFPKSNLVHVGERTNFAGSAIFKKMIIEQRYNDALKIARQQIENGANIIDINMDDAMINSEKEMVHFLNLVGSEPEIAKVPIMIDSSNWSVVESSLKCLQGKGIVNSISLKDGVDMFKQKAMKIKKYGASMVVMAFDELGQADTFERRIAVCQRSYHILTDEVGILPHNIIFDPNVLAIATGIEEHNTYALDFIKTVQWIKENLPHASVSGGISNLSFSFRGNNEIREILHVVFLHHAVKVGLDMAILNVGMSKTYNDIPDDLLEVVEDVLLYRNGDQTDKLIDFVGKLKTNQSKIKEVDTWRTYSLDKRIDHALIKGISDFIEEDMIQALQEYESPIQIIEGPLMNTMNTIGELFGAGKMFLPQIVKSARVMKVAVSVLQPYIDIEKGCKSSGVRGKILMLTVKGDVHDIGKNIVSVVLGCNNYEIVDLGVMTPCDKIIDYVKTHSVDIIGLSGLITPSLEEMIYVIKELEKNGINIPVLIGGATTSLVHTAVKMAPLYSGPVIHVLDASRCVSICNSLLNPETRDSYVTQLVSQYTHIRQQYVSHLKKTYISLSEARRNKPRTNWLDFKITKPLFLGNKVFQDYPISEIVQYIDWSLLFLQLGIWGRYPEILENQEAKKIYETAQCLLKDICEQHLLTANGVIGFYPVNSNDNDDIEVYHPANEREILTVIHTLRQQEDIGTNLSLSDFIAPKGGNRVDYLGLFAVTCGLNLEEAIKQYESDECNVLLIKTLSCRLAEAFVELLHERVRKTYWGYSPVEKSTVSELLKKQYVGIRPAPGYPMSPDHTEKGIIFDLLDVEKNTGIRLTESYAMSPLASICGYYFSHPFSKYFSLGQISRDQIGDYSKRKGMTVTEVEKWLNMSLNSNSSDSKDN